MKIRNQAWEWVAVAALFIAVNGALTWGYFKCWQAIDVVADILSDYEEQP